jgi:CheY-like chemotaxis protein
MIRTLPRSGGVFLEQQRPRSFSGGQSDRCGVCGEMLEQLGYSVTRASNGLEALEAIKHNGIDLMFSDIVMPGKFDGLDLARQIRRLRPEIPILLTTGYSGAWKSEFPILRKPCQIHELSEALAALAK